MKSSILIKSHDSKVYLAGLAFVTTIGVVIRLFYLFQPMCFDEACTYVILASKTPSLFLTHYMIYNNHPFHTLAVYISTRLAGNSNWAIRLPAFLAGVALIPATYFLVRKLFKNKVALLSAGVVAVLLPFVEYSTNARGYTMQTLFFVLATYFAISVLDSKKLYNWVALVLLTGLAFYTLPTSVYFFVPLYVWVFLTGILGDTVNNRKSFLTRCIVTGAGAILLVLCLYLPFIRTSGTGFLFEQRNSELLKNLFGQATWRDLTRVWSFAFSDISIGLGLVIAVGFVLFIIFNRRLSKRMFNLTAIMVVWWSMIILVTRLVPPQRVWLPIILLFLACSFAGLNYVLEEAYTYFKKKRPGFALGHQFVVIVVILLVIFLSIPPFLSRSPYQPRDQVTFSDARNEVRFLKPILKEGDAVLIDPDAYYLAKYYFLTEKVPLRYLYRQKENPLDLTKAKRIFICEASEEAPSYTIKNALSYSTIPVGTKCVVSPLMMFKMGSVEGIMNWGQDDEMKRLAEIGEKVNAVLREKGKSDYSIYWVKDKTEIIVSRPK